MESWEDMDEGRLQDGRGQSVEGDPEEAGSEMELTLVWGRRDRVYTAADPAQG